MTDCWSSLKLFDFDINREEKKGAIYNFTCEYKMFRCSIFLLLLVERAYHALPTENICLHRDVNPSSIVNVYPRAPTRFGIDHGWGKLHFFP